MCVCVCVQERTREWLRKERERLKEILQQFPSRGEQSHSRASPWLLTEMGVQGREEVGDEPK